MMQFERWSLLIIEEALLRGTTRRDDFQTFLGIAPDLLDLRLGALVRSGILTGSPDDDGEIRYELTTMGRDLETALAALDRWSRRWDPLARAELPPLDAVNPPDAETEAVTADPASPITAVSVQLSLLETFGLRVDGAPVEQLSPGSQRLLALLALRDRAIARIALAGTMWPAASDERAGISLRSALARLEPTARAAIVMTSTGLSLATQVTVDFRAAQALAHRLLRAGAPLEDGDLDNESIATLSRELLPDWYDDWIIAEADDWRHLRMNALEALAQRLLDAELFAEAATAARAAMRIDALRESSHATLVRVHLATGNQSEALGVYDRYRTMLLAALDIEPTSRLSELVESIQH